MDMLTSWLLAAPASHIASLIHQSSYISSISSVRGVSRFPRMDDETCVTLALENFKSSHARLGRRSRTRTFYGTVLMQATFLGLLLSTVESIVLFRQNELFDSGGQEEMVAY
jgi:hypothetical protein